MINEPSNLFDWAVSRYLPSALDDWLDQHGRTHDPELDQLRHTAARHPLDLPTTSEATMTSTARTVDRVQLRLEAEQTITLPVGARLLSVTAREGSMNHLDLWAEGDPDTQQIDATVHIVRQGDTAPDAGDYVGSVLLQLGGLVVHVYVDRT